MTCHFALVLSALAVSIITMVFVTYAIRIERFSASLRYTIGWTGVTASAAVPVILIPVLSFQTARLSFSIGEYGQKLFNTVLKLSPLIYPVLAILLCGLVCQIVRLSISIVVSRRVMFSARPLIRPDIQNRLDQCRERVAAEACPVLFTTQEIRHPSIWCWGLHPAILLPESFDTKISAEETEAIFLHELAHFVRQDHLSGLVVQIAGLFLFWNPLYHLILRRLDLYSDIACDRFVIEHSTIATYNYSELLVRLAADKRAVSIYRFFAQKETIMQRITSILTDDKIGRTETSRPIFCLTVWTFLTVILSAVTTIPILAVEAANAKKNDHPASLNIVFEKIGNKSVLKTDSSKTSAVDRFMSERRNRRQNIEKPGEEKIRAAEIQLQKVETAQKAGHPNGGLLQLAKAKHRLAELRAAQTQDEKYYKEVIDSAELCYILTKAQYDAGHSNGTIQNLARTFFEWKEAELNFSPLDKIPDLDTVDELLNAANMLYKNAQKAFQTGSASKSDVEAIITKSRAITQQFLPVWNELFLKNSAQLHIDIRSIHRSVADFPNEINLSSPANSYASYVLNVTCEKNSAQARKNFIALHHDDDIQIGPDDFRYNPKWAAILSRAELLEVITYRDRFAVVIALISGQDVQNPCDIRTFEKINGRWLNWGNSRFDSIEEARRDSKRLLLYLEGNSQQNTEEKKLLTEMKTDPNVRITQVNRPVSDWPITLEKTNSPESLYAVLKQTLASGDPQLITRLDRLQYKPSQPISPAERNQICNMESDWRKALQNAMILETIVCGEEAIVIARLRGEKVVKPFDVEWIQFDSKEGVWLNKENYRAASLEEAEQIFVKLIYQKK